VLQAHVVLAFSCHVKKRCDWPGARACSKSFVGNGALRRKAISAAGVRPDSRLTFVGSTSRDADGD
jgi:hypothetical protein